MRLIDGEFPDYNQVLPKKKGTLVEVSSGLLTQALRRASLMVTDKGKGVRLDFQKNVLRVSSSSPELGESSEELEVDYKGENLSIGFNARYLLDFASTVTEERSISLELSGELGRAGEIENLWRRIVFRNSHADETGMTRLHANRVVTNLSDSKS